MSDDESAVSGAVDPNANAEDDTMNELASSSESDEDEGEERQQRQRTV